MAAAPPHSSLLHSILFIFLVSLSSAQPPSFRPKALVLPVKRDDSSLQYITTITQRTPPVSLNLVVDLGGQFLWTDCERNFVSSTYRQIPCRTAQCSLSGSKACACADNPKCNNSTCTISPDNTVTRTGTVGELSDDVLSLRSTDGSNPGRIVSVSRFLFSCAPTFLLQGLASGTSGMAGLGRGKIGLPSLLASAFSFRRKFALCLSSGNGVIFFGDGPYKFLPNVDPTGSLTFTKLFVNPVSTASGFFLGEPSVEYFIGVQSIKIGDKIVVPLNKSLLSIDENGNGGTKISTVNPYTLMESSIYKAFTDTFIKALNVTRRIGSVAPFEFCFRADSFPSTRVGPGVPFIDLVLESESVTWTLTGSSSMVDVGNGVLCLGFIDGGLNPTTSIVIGGHQIEEKLLQFDLASSRLGFSPVLSLFRTSCSNFNFTSNP